MLTGLPVRFGDAGEAVTPRFGKLDREFPNQMAIVFAAPRSVRPPREHFPAFDGCFVWHSSVHGHRLLTRPLRVRPDMPVSDLVRTRLKAHLSAENLKRGVAFFAAEDRKSFERMYGWAWFLRLVTELEQWDHGDGTIEPVAVTDLTDGKLVHSAGLNLDRAWCMDSVAKSLPDDHPLRATLRQCVWEHLESGLAYVNSGHYEGDHWLATFAIYSITAGPR